MNPRNIAALGERRIRQRRAEIDAVKFEHVQHVDRLETALTLCCTEARFIRERGTSEQLRWRLVEINEIVDRALKSMPLHPISPPNSLDDEIRAGAAADSADGGGDA